MYDKNALHGYAMKAEELSKETGDTFAGSIEVDSVAKALGIEKDQGRNIASYLGKLGWAKVSFAQEPPILTVTPLGYEEIAKLRWTPMRLWIHKNTAVAALIVSGLAFLFSIASFVLQLFWKASGQ